MSEQEESEETHVSPDSHPVSEEEAPSVCPEPEAVRGVEGLLPVLEALLFAAGDPVTLEEMQSAVPAEEKAHVEAALQRLCADYGEERGLQIVPLAGGYRMVTRSSYDRYIRALLRQRNRRRLGPASLETLAIVAYRQPITGPEISEIRGKDSAGVMKSLLDKRLLRITGRKRVVGKPFLYGTTREFLLHFGLDSVSELPELAEFEGMLQERMALMGQTKLPGLDDGTDEIGGEELQEAGLTETAQEPLEATEGPANETEEASSQEMAVTPAEDLLDRADQAESLED